MRSAGLFRSPLPCQVDVRHLLFAYWFMESRANCYKTV